MQGGFAMGQLIKEPIINTTIVANQSEKDERIATVEEVKASLDKVSKKYADALKVLAK